MIMCPSDCTIVRAYARSIVIQCDNRTVNERSFCASDTPGPYRGSGGLRVDALYLENFSKKFFEFQEVSFRYRRNSLGLTIIFIFNEK
jgi:hypothetical protein